VTGIDQIVDKGRGRVGESGLSNGPMPVTSLCRSRELSQRRYPGLVKESEL
jgi:hypothetical protein